MNPKIRLAALLLASAFSAGPLGAQVAVTVDATNAVRTVDDRMFGINTPFWDTSFSDAKSTDAFTQMNTRFMRFGGGSATDNYNWETGKDMNGTQWAVTVDAFAAQARAVGSKALITVNYGNDTPAHAAAYVNYCNVTKGYGFKYWEVGNECYGTWEADTNTHPHDPYTYGTRAAQYIQMMKAVDPTIKIGVVAAPGEDAYSNNYSAHPATNPRTNVAHNGWVPVMLATMKAAGVMPDFIIDHRYEQNPLQEGDAILLQAATSWSYDATNLRQMLTDYLGSASGSPIEILVTENNSVSSNPGKQSTSLVDGLYLADSTANLMLTEINSLLWWDFHNGINDGSNATPSNPAPNLSSSLYGWRLYGDYGVESGAHDRYPTFYVSKLLTHFARGGDTVVTATSADTLLSAYAVKRLDGTLSILVINKSPTATKTASISLTGFAPQASATEYSYGIPQDLNSEENAASASAPVTNFSWENSLEGWVNQSGQPDDTTTNFGLDAPFLYSLSYSTSNGVTSGSYSLACTTTSAAPGNSAVIQNPTAAIGTAMSTASSVSVSIYPQTSSSGTLQASIYINGKNLPYVLLGTATLTANQENTVTFPLTDAQRSGVTASLGTSNWFQVGININAPGPIICYFDNFAITPLATPTPTPTSIPGAAASPDLAVSTLSGMAANFSASFGPYSATVISLSGPTSAPAATSQPSSQTVASGSTVVFSFGVTGAPAPACQWYLNGTAVPSATSATLVLSGATSANSGTYKCVATNSTGTVTSANATLNVTTTSDPGRLVNLSCRAAVGTGANILIVGFVSGGSGVGGIQPLLIRGTGPALAAFGVAGTLVDPALSLYQKTNLLNSNAGWGANASQITAEDSAVGAFPLSDTKSLDSALYLTNLAPNGYTAQIAGASNDTGVALAEVYDATPSGTYAPTTPRLINLSARVQVGTGGNILIAGFVIGGTTSKTVLVRASGPALAGFGVAGTLADPQLQLKNPAGTVLASNTGWGGDAQVASAASSVGAFSWTASSADSAVLVTLPPGPYTAQVSGASGDTGVALVEVYEVP